MLSSTYTEYVETSDGPMVLVVENEPVQNWVRLIDNAFCPTGPGGGIDNTCSPGGGGSGGFKGGHDLLSTLKSKTNLKINPEFAQKIAWINPNGIQNGTVIMPKKMSDTPEKIAQLQKVLPPGTVIKQVSFKPDTMQKMTPEQFAKQGKIISSAPKQTTPYAPLPSLPSGKAGLETITTLSGSTAPVLMKDPSTGQRWVVKSPGKGGEGHLKSEADTDAIYRAMGVPVPTSGFVGGVKMGAFLEGGETLNNWKVGKSQSEIKAMHKEISKNFVLDAVTANWDVIGMTQDNIMIQNGKPFRIDNGGALAYRAQGGLKGGAFTHEVNELESMRNGSKNPSTAKVYKSLTNKDIVNQIKEVTGNKMKILDQITDPDVREIMSKRIDNLKVQAAKYQSKIDAKKEWFKGKKGEQATESKGQAYEVGGSKGISHEFHGYNFKQATSMPTQKIKKFLTKVETKEGGSYAKHEVTLPKTNTFVSSKDHMNWKASLTHMERDAISSWKGSSTSMRKGMKSAIESGSQLPGAAKNLLSAIEKHPPQPGVYYRGIKLSGDKEMAFVMAAQKAMDSGGGFLFDQLPHGMSVHPRIARQFSGGSVMTRIVSKNARPIIKSDGFSNEAEVINPATSYRVRGIYPKTTLNMQGTHASTVNYFIELEEI